MGYSPWGHKESDMTEQVSTVRVTNHCNSRAKNSVAFICKKLLTIQLYLIFLGQNLFSLEMDQMHPDSQKSV